MVEEQELTLGKSPNLFDGRDGSTLTFAICLKEKWERMTLSTQCLHKFSFVTVLNIVHQDTGMRDFFKEDYLMLHQALKDHNPIKYVRIRFDWCGAVAAFGFHRITLSNLPFLTQSCPLFKGSHEVTIIETASGLSRLSSNLNNVQADKQSLRHFCAHLLLNGTITEAHKWNFEHDIRHLESRHILSRTITSQKLTKNTLSRLINNFSKKIDIDNKRRRGHKIILNELLRKDILDLLRMLQKNTPVVDENEIDVPTPPPNWNDFSDYLLRNPRRGPTNGITLQPLRNIQNLQNIQNIRRQRRNQ